MNWSLREMAGVLTGATLVAGPSVAVRRIHTDTRSLESGDLYVALTGDKFDGNAMLAKAKAAGAVAAIAHVRRGDGIADVGLCGFEVPDTRKALGELGRAWRMRFQGPLIAVTGSNGKTTVTQMLANILRCHAGDGSHATRKSFNNDIGLPLTLLGLRTHHTHAVVEIGMNHPGEIDALAALAVPTVALVNNAQREHQEFMGSVDAVAEENACVFAHTKAGGYAVFPASDKYTDLWTRKAKSHDLVVRTFGDGGDFWLERLRTQDGHAGQSIRVHTPAGSEEVRLALPGEHNASNALAAAACAWCAGVPLPTIAQGLATFQAVEGRSRLVSLRGALRSLVLIDDTYNANPDSARAAIDILSAQPQPRWLVLGEMGEVGDQGPQFHDEVGRYAASKSIQRLWGCGALAEYAIKGFLRQGGSEALALANTDAAIEHIGKELQRWVHQSHCGAQSMLVKGSRFMQMERVVAAVEHIDQSSSVLGPSAAQKESHAA